MKQIILLPFLLFGLIHNLSAQKVNLTDPLPVDKSIIKGVLPNGLTYYIKKTSVTKGVASYYIIQNVGSVLENDDQRGLAHFLEHMAFNGTQNFKGKAILNTMQQHGLVFGRDINAYTSFDETVYNINNIPSTPEMIDKGLLVLHDWSHYLSLTDQEIDAERGVIKEEWRTRQNGDMRLFEQTSGVIFNNTKYANRFPIGKMSVVENFKYSALRDFYQQWYRTDLQAIAIIGDIDPAVIEAKIKAGFSKIPAVKNPKERFIIEVPDHQEMLYKMAMDNEVTTSAISLGIRHHLSLKNQTIANLKEDLLHVMIIKMLSGRLEEMSHKTTSPFLQTSLYYSENTKTSKDFSVNIVPKPNEQQAAFTTVVTELSRAVKFGFTAAEINRTVAEIESTYENQIISKDNKTHEDIENLIQRNYLQNETITDIDAEYDIVKSILSELTPDQLHTAIKKMYTDQNRYLVVTGVKGENNLSQDQAIAIFKSVENNPNLAPYTDAFEGKTLISNIDIKSGSILSESNDKEIGAKTFILSNGIKVHYKYANKIKNDVQLKASSYGGNSLLSDADLPSSSALSSVIQNSGLGDYSTADLPKVLAGKSAQVNMNISGITESLSGVSVTKDTETMLQMVYLHFMKPRFDANGYEVTMQNFRNYLVSRSENIQEKINDSITVSLYGPSNAKKRIFNQQYLNDISFDKVKSIYNTRFGNAGDFEFFIVGDIEEKTLRPLLEKYIAGITTSSQREQWKNNAVPWLEKNTSKNINLKMTDPKSSVNICYKNNCSFSLKNQLLSKVLADLLQLRFTETLREQEGGTYGASTSGNVMKRPVQEAFIAVNFDCNPDKADKLISIVQQEILKISNAEIQQTDLDKILTNYIKDRQQEKDLNAYDMELLSNFYLEGYDMDKPENFEAIVKSINKKEIAAFTQSLLNNAKSYQIVFRPQL